MESTDKMTNYSSIPSVEPVLDATIVSDGITSSAPAIAAIHDVVDGTTMVTVLAPATLPMGYKFYGIYEGTEFPVTVPVNGVRSGQQMVVPFQQQGEFHQQTTTSTENGVAAGGRWKDDLFDCCKHGPCHPSLLCACCCQLILLGQVMTRLKLNWLGDSEPYGAKNNTCRIMVLITFLFGIWGMVFNSTINDDQNIEVIALDDYDTVETIETITIDDTQSGWYNFGINLHFAFVLFLTWKVRKYIRAKNQIPEKNCVGCEDFCCSLWCGCCVLSQVARQTADYDQEKAQCCSVTGVHPTERVLIV